MGEDANNTRSDKEFGFATVAVPTSRPYSPDLLRALERTFTSLPVFRPAVTRAGCPLGPAGLTVRLP